MALSRTAAMALELPSEPETAEDRLIAACRKGDPEAFAELVRQHERRVFRLASRFFRRREEVEDVAQETFLQVWRKLHTYRARAPFEHWLTRVCLNCCYARLRKEKPGEEALEREPGVVAGDPAVRVEVEGLLSKLKPADRFVLVLLHGEGRSVEEISKLLGWSRSKVKVRAHRARAGLRRLLEEGMRS